MAEPKTRPTDASVKDFLGSVAVERRRIDAIELNALMQEVSGEAPVLWGTSIVGYGEVTSTDARGKPTIWPAIGFSPRKTELVLYLDASLDDALFENLGPHRRGVGCLYLKRLAEVDPDELRRILARSLELAHR